MSDTMKMYEGLFLFPQSASGNLQEAADHVQELLKRAGAEVVSFAKWDERRLAYEIKGNKRGVYFLTYFKAEPGSLAGLERDCNLSEDLLRAMVTSAELIPTETVEGADARDKLADEIKLRAEKDEKGRAAGGRESSRVVDAKTRAEEEAKKAAEAAAAKAEEAASAEGDEAKAEGDEAKAEAAASE